MNETKNKRTEIMIETRNLTVIRIRNDKSNFSYCQKCGENVGVFSLAHAAVIFGVEERFLEQLFESTEIHRAGEAALCGNSLINYFK